MADTALFSSFRRPGAPLDTPPSDEAAGATAGRYVPTTVAPPEHVAKADSVDEGHAATASALAAPVAIASATQASWSVASVAVGSDQLGLTHPEVITLHVGLRSSPAVPLEALTAGIYRPVGFRAAPWGGVPVSKGPVTSTGLAAGTRILTAKGEVEVERLVVGDTAMALRGPGLLPISSIGRAGASAAPILIEPGALGPNIPRRPLCVGPQQAIFLTPDAVAAHTLVNGTTIRAAEAADAELFLVDLGRPEVILAEGLAVSSGNAASKRG